MLQEVRSIIYFQQFVHPLSLRWHGNGTSFTFKSDIIVSIKFCNVTYLNTFYFVSFLYHLFICWCQRKIRLVTLCKSYLYKFFFQSFFLVYWASFFHICLHFWTQIKHPKLFLKHKFWREKRAHCITYNKICTTIIVHITLLILGEIWSKWSNFTSLLLVEVCGEVAEVNTKALNIKSCQPRQKHCRGKAKAKCIFT